VGALPDSDSKAIAGFHPVHRVAQSYLGSLWIALDKRQGDPGTTVLLRGPTGLRNCLRQVERTNSAAVPVPTIRTRAVSKSATSVRYPVTGSDKTACDLGMPWPVPASRRLDRRGRPP